MPKKRDPKKGTGKKPKGSGRRLYTDENPKDTVKIKFATPADARATVAKVKKIKKPFARKIQILTVGEQRAKVMGKNQVVSIFKKGKEAISFASNKNAYGICDISGFRYRLKDMRKTWDGLLVGPDQYDPKHPQLQPRHKPADPEALRDPRPNTDFEVGQGKVVTTEDPIGTMIIGNKLTASIGNVTITT
jgi:hypothetical protein